MNNEQMLKDLRSELGSIGFIGAGKVGCTIGKHLTEHGYQVQGYYSRSETSASYAAEFTNSQCYLELCDLIKDSDTLFLTVPDGAIADVWDHMQQLPADVSGKTVCHMSGSLSSDIFLRVRPDISGYSIHPLFAISDKAASYKEISKCVFTIEGTDGPKKEALTKLFAFCGNAVESVTAEQKALYHAAAVVSSNFVVGLSYLGSEMLKQCGFSEENASKALLPLLLGSVDNIARQGSINALTGPVERNDVGTIEKHLAAFDQGKLLDESQMNWDALIDTYKDLTKWLIEIGKKRPGEEDYSELSKIVSDN